MSSTFGPTNSLVCPLLTDMYQISMSYAYWKNGKANDHAVFELFFRKNPFQGEYCIFAGQDEVLKLLSTFRFKPSDTEYLKSIMPTCEPDFFDWLLTLDCSGVKVYAMEDGTVVFPREPLMSIEGPLVVVQLLETVLLNLINFPSLIATNAARMRLAAGANKKLLEFGLRRAQGPDGGLSASKYACLGGFDGTSNVLAGRLFDIAVKGTHAHAFVMCYTGLQDLKFTTIAASASNSVGVGAGAGGEVEFVQRVLEKREALHYSRSNEGELAAFIAYAQSFPSGFLALVDTYDTLGSGIQNFLCVAWVLQELGYRPLGIRLDSGDLAYFSKEIRKLFREFDAQHYPGQGEVFGGLNIVASNDINEDVLLSLNREGHEIDTFGIGTHLVTCQKQPALGCVYKLVEINGQPRIKLSQDMEKLVIPGRKQLYRLYGQDGRPLVDLLQTAAEPAPRPLDRMLVRHPFAENKRAYVRPVEVKQLLRLIYDGSRCGPPLPSPPSHSSMSEAMAPLAPSASASTATATVAVTAMISSAALAAETEEADARGARGIVTPARSLAEARAFCAHELERLRRDHIRPLNPTPYKLSVSPTLFDYMHKLWLDEAPIADLC